MVAKIYCLRKHNIIHKKLIYGKHIKTYKENAVKDSLYGVVGLMEAHFEHHSFQIVIQQNYIKKLSSKIHIILNTDFFACFFMHPSNETQIQKRKIKKNAHSIDL